MFLLHSYYCSVENLSESFFTFYSLLSEETFFQHLRLSSDIPTLCPTCSDITTLFTTRSDISYTLRQIPLYPTFLPTLTITNVRQKASTMTFVVYCHFPSFSLLFLSLLLPILFAFATIQPAVHDPSFL